MILEKGELPPSSRFWCSRQNTNQPPPRRRTNIPPSSFALSPPNILFKKSLNGKLFSRNRKTQKNISYLKNDLKMFRKFDNIAVFFLLQSFPSSTSVHPPPPSSIRSTTLTPPFVHTQKTGIIFPFRIPQTNEKEGERRKRGE